MRSPARSALALPLVLIVVATVIAVTSRPEPARAWPVGLTTNPLGSQEVGKNFDVQYAFTDDSPTATLSWTGVSVSYFSNPSTGNGRISGAPGGQTCVPTSQVTQPFIEYLAAGCLDGIDADGQATVVVTSVTFQCTSTGPVVFTLHQLPGADLTTNFLCIVAPTPTPPTGGTGGGGGGGGTGGGGPVFDDCSDFISPDVRGECNSLPTTDDALNCDDFQTSDEATAFTQLFDSDDTNNLDGDNDGVSCEDELPTAEELEACGPPPGFNTSIPFGCTVVVTANPNVVMCGGQSLITATVRNRAGHVVPGFGFHFATDNGLLIVGPPNDAAAEQALAILQLFPPGSNAGPATLSSSVEVSVGLTRGITIHGAVLVQQQCSSSNTTAGRINLTASAPNVACGGRAFIAGTFKDVNGNPVPDDTDITFLASAGSVADEAVSTAATPTAGSGNKPSVKVKTKGGTANIIYTADGGAKGIVRITAASGASFGYLDLPVCAVVGGVTPPNTGTGVSIRPPNTGDGGVPR